MVHPGNEKIKIEEVMEKSVKNFNATENYTTVAKLFHWILSILIMGMLAVGWYMVSFEDKPNIRIYFDLHKSFGLIVGALVLLRLLWRFSHKTPPLPTTVPAWQANAARLVHWLLYVCIILMPLTGFLASSFGKYGIAFFGLPLPRWVNQNHDISSLLFKWHGIIAWVLVVLIVLHVLAAFKHLFINKDRIFQRMWF